MTRLILHDVLIQDTETKNIYTFTPCEYTVSEMNNELGELNLDEVDDIKKCPSFNVKEWIKENGISNI